MKKAYSFVLLFILSGLSSLYSADCYTAFSYDVSVAYNTYVTDDGNCSGVPLCTQEAQYAYQQAIDNAISEWTRCCVLNNLGC